MRLKLKFRFFKHFVSVITQKGPKEMVNNVGKCVAHWSNTSDLLYFFTTTFSLTQRMPQDIYGRLFQSSVVYGFFSQVSCKYCMLRFNVKAYIQL